MIDSRRRMTLYGQLWDMTEFELCQFDHTKGCNSDRCLFKKGEGDVCVCGHVRYSHGKACRCGCKKFNEGTAT